MAYSLGDPTAKDAGRLTLNPLKHLDPIGSVLLPAFLIWRTGMGFGWAKPVPVNPNNFKGKFGEVKVALAGPFSNLLVALILGLALRAAIAFSFVNQGLFTVLTFIVSINIFLALFNLIPIPPLDGSHVLFFFLPYSARGVKMFLGRYGFFLLIFLIFFFPEFTQTLAKGGALIFRLIVGAG